LSLVVNRIDFSGVFATPELEQIADRVVKRGRPLVLTGAG